MDAAEVVRRKLAALEARREVLLEVLAELEGVPAAAPAVAAAARVTEAPQVEDRPRGKADRPGGGPMAKRVRDVLKDGPLGTTEIARRLGVEPGTIAYALRSPWFEKADPANRLSPWRLTEAGRASLSV